MYKYFNNLLYINYQALFINFFLCNVFSLQ